MTGMQVYPQHMQNAAKGGRHGKGNDLGKNHMKEMVTCGTSGCGTKKTFANVGISLTRGKKKH